VTLPTHPDDMGRDRASEVRRSKGQVRWAAAGVAVRS
jgi:hypothetical protein